MTLRVTVASAQRSFSKLNIVKNFMRSTMTQKRLNELAILSIESEVTRKIDFTDIIDMFAMKKVNGHFNYQIVLRPTHTGRDSPKRCDFSLFKTNKPVFKSKI